MSLILTRTHYTIDRERFERAMGLRWRKIAIALKTLVRWVKTCNRQVMSVETTSIEKVNCTRLIRGLIVPLLFRQAF